MALIWFGALCIVAGVVLATLRTLGRGRLSQPRRLNADEAPDTLEPSGRGDRLSLGADLPGIGLAVFGAVLIFVGALT
jgi:drug/metabolite transporter (DMT)-like permease